MSQRVGRLIRLVGARDARRRVFAQGMTVSDAPSLLPDLTRAEAIDADWRRRLIDSLRYVETHLAEHGHDVRGEVEVVRARAAEGAVSPWTYCLYSKLVADVSKRDFAAARASAAALRDAACAPAARQALALGAPEIPAMWWDHFRLLMDTDRARPFHPALASPEDVAACEGEIAEALALLAEADPVWSDELRSLMRVVVVGAPDAAEGALVFDAVSSFFLRGAVLLNAAKRRSIMQMVDVLIHESSHILLFGLAVDQSLTTDRGDERHASPLRDDPRPMEGVFHACFVATRVSLAMSRMIASGRLTDRQASEAAERRERNGRAARASLQTLKGRAAPTAFGKRVLASLDDFWAETAAA